MRRKLVLQGKTSLTLSLPKKWTKLHSLKAGDEVDITEEPRFLHLSTTTTPPKREQTLNITSENEPFLRVILNNLYRKGIDKITINYQTPKQAKIITNVTNNFLLGFEITEKNKNKIIIENITGTSEEKQETLLRRMFLLIKESFNLLQEDVERNTFKNLAQIKQHTKKVASYDNFCRRTISKMTFKEPHSHFYWGLYTYLILIQHSILHLYEALPAKPQLSPKLKKLPEELQKNFDLIYQGFIRKDLDLIKKGNNAANNLLNTKLHPQLKKTKGSDSILLYYLSELSRTTYLTTAPILGLLLK